MKAILVLFSLMVILLLMMENVKTSVRNSPPAKLYGSQTKPKNRALFERNKKGIKQSSSKENNMKKKQTENHKMEVKGENMKAERTKGKKKMKNNKSKYQRKNEKNKKGKNKKNNNGSIAHKNKLLKKGKRKEKYKHKRKMEHKKKIKYYKQKQKTNIKHAKKQKTANNSSRLGIPRSQCDFKFMADKKKERRKYQFAQAKLQRIVAFWNLLSSKAEIDDLPTATFKSPFDSLSSATNGGTTCECGPIPTVPLEIYTKLSKCTDTAAWACSTNSIIYDDQVTSCNTALGHCKASCTVDSGITPQCPASCHALDGTALDSACSVLSSPARYELTQAMIDYMKDTCIPELSKWNTRYTQCGTHYPTTDCKSLCQTYEDRHDCQVSECVCKNPETAGLCDYEKCVHDAHASGDSGEDCQCLCFKTIDTYFPIDNTRVFFPINGHGVGLNCMELAGFDRLIKTRKDRCMKAGGITEAENSVTNSALSGLPPIQPVLQAPPSPLGPGAGLTPLNPTAGQRDSGNFGDCRYQAREAFPWIYTCTVKSCNSNTTVVTTKSSTKRKKFLDQMKKYRGV